MVQKATEQGDWDVVWTAPNNLDPAIWEKPYSGNASANVTESGINLFAADLNSYAGLRYKNYSDWFGVRVKYEVELMITTAGRNNGIRIVLCEGTNGVSSGRGIQIAIYRERIIVHNSSTTNLDVSNATSNFPIQYGVWNRITLSLDTINGKNEIFLNGDLVCTQSNGELNRAFVTSWWTVAQSGDIEIRAVRYKKYE